MKSFSQLVEDIAQKRQEISDRRSAQMDKEREEKIARREADKEKIQRQRERDDEREDIVQDVIKRLRNN
jgi:hypothetical protein